MGHVLRFTCWDPELDINPQYEHLREQLPVEKWGAILDHPNAQTGKPCSGGLTFDGPVQAEIDDRPRWTVESWDPLTLAPSVLCKAKVAGVECGDHGFIRGGVWVPA
jgi:hypothetical protein